MSLDDIKAIKAHRLDGQRRGHGRRGWRVALLPRRPGELPTTSLLATVPVSVRNESKRDKGANKVSALFAKLGTDVEDPLERLTS